MSPVLISFAQSSPRAESPNAWRGGGRAHLVGIGGAGMGSLAKVLHEASWTISGSDLYPCRGHTRWRTAVGHSAANIEPDVDIVVQSPAIDEDNAELNRARCLGIPVVGYPAMLGCLMHDRFGVAIAGTHGKSTTTAMAAEILSADGFDPTVVVGASPLDDGMGSRFGRGDMVLVEACEYRGSFLQLRPQVAAILGIEPDHFDFFRSDAQLDEAFARFAAKVPDDGMLLFNADCNRTRRTAGRAPCRRESFGLTAAADWQARELSSDAGNFCFEIWHHGQRRCNVALQVPGRHHVLDALAAAAVANHCGASGDAIARGLGRFRGLRRRLELVGEPRGIAIVDDCAHHPTEIAAALAALRLKYPNRRLCCVFQPHQVSRTACLLDELAASLQNADTLCVAEIFRAREGEPRSGEVTAADLACRAQAAGAHVMKLHDLAAIEQYLEQTLRPGNVLVTLGAGDIGKTAHDISKRIREHGSLG